MVNQNSKHTVKQFKGQVKISDVQKEFDALVGRINAFVEEYNASDAVVQNIDYTTGGTGLAPSGYTLTVGGLKQALAATDGLVLGSKVFELNTAGKLVISDGLLLSKYGMFRLPSQELSLPTNSNTLYFNTKSKQYQWVQGLTTGIVSNTINGLTLQKVPDTTEYLLDEFRGEYSTVPYFFGINKTVQNYVDSFEFTFPYNITEQDVISVDKDGNQCLLGINGSGFKLGRYPFVQIPLNTKDVILEYKDAKLGNYGVILGYYDFELSAGTGDVTERFTPKILVRGTSDINRNLSKPAIATAPIPINYRLAEGYAAYVYTGKEFKDYRTSKMFEGGWETYGVTDTPPRKRVNGYLWDTLEGGGEVVDLPDNIYDNANVIYDDKVRLPEVPEGYTPKSYEVRGIRFRIKYDQVNEVDEPKDNLPYTLVAEAQYLDANGYDIAPYLMHSGDFTDDWVFENGVWNAPPIIRQTKARNVAISNYKLSGTPHENGGLLGECNCAIFITTDYNNTVGNYLDISKYYPSIPTEPLQMNFWKAGQPDDRVYRITDVAKGRDSKYLNDVNNLQCENIDGEVNIYSQNRNFNVYEFGMFDSGEILDTSKKPKFIAGVDPWSRGNEGEIATYLDGKKVSWNRYRGSKGSRNLDYYAPINFLFVPKGCPNPYTHSGLGGATGGDKVYNVTIERKLWDDKN